MKKGFAKLVVAVVLLFSLLASNSTVYADGPKVSYINKNGIVITYEDQTRLEGIGFDKEDIDNMTQEEYDENKGVYAESTSRKEVYIKTVYTYADENSVSDENAIPISTQSYELDEPTFEKDLALDKLYSSKDPIYTSRPDLAPVYSSDVKDTNDLNIPSSVVADEPNLIGISSDSPDAKNSSSDYKTLTIDIAKKSNGKYLLKSTMKWKKMPKNRGKDLYAIGYSNSDNDYARINSSVVGKQHYVAYTMTKSKSDTFTYTLADDPNTFTLSSSGVVVMQDLKNNWDNYKVAELTQSLKFDIEVDGGINTNWVTTEAGYKHRTADEGSISVSDVTVSFGGGSSGVDGSLSVTLKKDKTKYDGLYKVFWQQRR